VLLSREFDNRRFEGASRHIHEKSLVELTLLSTLIRELNPKEKFKVHKFEDKAL